MVVIDTHLAMITRNKINSRKKDQLS